MKKFLRTALVLPLVLFAVSCSESNDDGGDDKPVKLSPETKQEQQVYADDKQAPAPIKFTATAPWTATVAEVQTKAEAGSEVDWLKLSAYKGNPGDISLTMTLSPNYTGTDRKAEIRIACGGTIITVTVEQKGTTESGKVPEDPDKPNPIELSGETPTQQTVWADETQTPKNIAFKALAPWTATVSEAAANTKAEGGNKADWLTLSKYAGEAGEVSLTATLSPNYTRADRKAEIRITCNDKTVVLTVEQKATKADGTLPEDPDKPEQPDLKNRIMRIVKYRYYEMAGLDPIDEYYEFEYDETGRVTNVKWHESGDEVDGVTVEENTTVTYKDGSVSYESKHTEGSGTSTSTGSIVLDENGRAVSGKSNFRDMYEGFIEAWSYIYNLTYNAEGHLIETNVTEKDDNTNKTENSLYKITWANGNPTQAFCQFPDSESFVDEATYGPIENKTNIDLNWLLLLDTEAWDFATGDPTHIFSMMGYMGKRPQNMVKSVTDGYSQPHFTSTYDYQLDNEGRIAKIIEITGDGTPNRIEYLIFYAE